MKLHYAAVGALGCLLLSPQAFAAAKASDVDPARDRIGQIVYPLGVHPPKDSGTTKGVRAQYPKGHDSARNKDD